MYGYSWSDPAEEEEMEKEYLEEARTIPYITCDECDCVLHEGDTYYTMDFGNICEACFEAWLLENKKEVE